VLLLALEIPSSSNNQFSRLRNARQVHRNPPQSTAAPTEQIILAEPSALPASHPSKSPLAAAPQAHPEQPAPTDRTSSSPSFLQPADAHAEQQDLPTPASSLELPLLLSSFSGFVSSAPIHGRRRVQHQQSSCASAASAWPTGGAWTQGWGLFLRLPLCGFDLNPVTALQLIATLVTLRKGARFTIAACTECYHHTIKDLHCDYLLSAKLPHLHLEIQASPSHLLPVQPRATPRQPLAPKR
jgi:hypothetical protein